MDREQFDLLMFYCWQLKIITVAELEWFKKLHNVRTNEEMLNRMAYVYNRA